MKRIASVLTLVFALITAACVTFGAYFSYVTLLGADRATLEERFAVTALRVSSTAELASSLGISLNDQSTLADLVQREAVLDRAVRSIDVSDERGRVIFSSDPAREGTTLPDRSPATVRRFIENDIGTRIGRVSVTYDPAVLQRDAERLATDIRTYAVPAVILAALITLLAGALVLRGVQRALRHGGNAAAWPSAAQDALARVDTAHAAAFVGPTPAGETR